MRILPNSLHHHRAFLDHDIVDRPIIVVNLRLPHPLDVQHTLDYLRNRMEFLKGKRETDLMNSPKYSMLSIKPLSRRQCDEEL